mmetsp:Transcript_2856/g.11627  ORF Transcript_2856/g.11627 Transcript_2856/m.11627 type:complete len:253 (+) Transcript_2856:565-1323(+)
MPRRNLKVADGLLVILRHVKAIGKALSQNEGRLGDLCAVTPERAFNLHSMVLQLVVEVARIRVEPQSRRDPLPSLLEDRPVLVFGPRAASFPCRRFSWRMLILVEAARNAHRHLQLRERQRFERNGTDWSGQDILFHGTLILVASGSVAIIAIIAIMSLMTIIMINQRDAQSFPRHELLYGVLGVADRVDALPFDELAVDQERPTKARREAPLINRVVQQRHDAIDGGRDCRVPQVGVLRLEHHLREAVVAP